jgi:hypothetical protein
VKKRIRFEIQKGVAIVISDKTEMREFFSVFYSAFE